MCCNDSVINISHLTCGDSFMQGNTQTQRLEPFSVYRKKFARFTSQEM